LLRASTNTPCHPDAINYLVTKVLGKLGKAKK
jgi:hypothetical protein